MANGIVGLKPTYGRVSRHGVLVLAESLDHVGPMTRRTADAAIMLAAMAGHDPQDPTSLRDPVPDMLADSQSGTGTTLAYHFDQRGQIAMLLIYDKAADDLSPVQKRMPPGHT